MTRRHGLEKGATIVPIILFFIFVLGALCVLSVVAEENPGDPPVIKEPSNVLSNGLIQFGLPVKTDRYIYCIGEPIKITYTGPHGGDMVSSGPHPEDLHFIIKNENNETVAECPQFWCLGCMVVGYEWFGTVTWRWNQTYRVYGESKAPADLIPPSGEQVPSGKYYASFETHSYREVIGHAEFEIVSLNKSVVADIGSDQTVYVGDTEGVIGKDTANVTVMEREPSELYVDVTLDDSTNDIREQTEIISDGNFTSPKKDTKTIIPREDNSMGRTKEDINRHTTNNRMISSSINPTQVDPTFIIMAVVIFKCMISSTVKKAPPFFQQ